MKTFFKNILVLAVMLGTCTGYANASLEVPTFNSVKKGNSISVTDAVGEVVFSGLINYDGNISHLYDFSQLKDGIYTIEVEKAFEIEVNIVEVKNHNVNFLNKKSEKIFKPVFRTENNRLMISKIALNNSKMEIELYYDNELIHSEMANGSDILNRVYKFDNTVKGEYTAVVKSNGRVFTETFKI
ncbi:hypothetical protein [Winogradskyella psychrotolerans]|uniref:hypothetical protein n=1 Tax=Winogradskyella psychrotolerans TaxID=1344585 RepID=UPI001C06AE13|nr:hypothetical protein [Winogradskyella psychrotolerans]MBU2926873.1 hypothetical protein [Winogradskyella psychrotolerans]